MSQAGCPRRRSTGVKAGPLDPQGLGWGSRMVPQDGAGDGLWRGAFMGANRPVRGLQRPQAWE